MTDLLIGIFVVIFVRQVVARKGFTTEHLYTLVVGLMGWYLLYRLWHRFQPREILGHYECLQTLYHELPVDGNEIDLRITYWVPSRLLSGKLFQLTPYFPKTFKNGRGRYLGRDIDHFAAAAQEPGVLRHRPVIPSSPSELVRTGVPRRKAELARQEIEASWLVGVVGTDGALLGILYMDGTDEERMFKAFTAENDDLDNAVQRAIFELRRLDDEDWKLRPGSYHALGRARW